MYFVTTICFAPGHPHHEDARCFGYYITPLDAVRAVLNNACDIHECLYTHAVVEKIGPGIHPMSESEVWFEWRRDKERWDYSEKPEWSERVINWALG